MFKLDHIMIETKSPQCEANKISEYFGLPLAWPLIATENYTSIGVNFGSINIEFIDFRTRFGVSGKSYSGMSGIAYRIDGAEKDAIKTLMDTGLNIRIGEKAKAHTTYTIEEEQVFPTLFLVKYHFDTSGWQTRLSDEFHSCGGGKFRLSSLDSLVCGTTLPVKIKTTLGLSEDKNLGTKSKIIFNTESGLSEPQMIAGLIKELDIILI